MCPSPLSPTPGGDPHRLRLRPFLALGLAAFFVAALRYRSYRPTILDRWSTGYFLGLLGLLGVAVLVWLWGVRSASRSHDEAQATKLRRRFFDLAVLLVGLASLRGAVLSPMAGARFLELNFLGSSDPWAAALQWLAMICLLLAGCLWIHHLQQEHLKRIGVAIAAFALVLVLVEGLLRLRVAIHPTTQGFPTYSSEAWEQRQVLNRDGFRDVEREILAAPGVRRVLVVGDSSAFGYGLDNTEDRFGELLAQRLREQSGQAFEAITAALPNTNTLQHLEFLRSGLRYDPDVVVLLYALDDNNYLVKRTPEASRVRLLRSATHPAGIAYRNFYTFQEAYVRLRSLRWQQQRERGDPEPPVPEDVLARHLDDLHDFVSLAEQKACVAAITPHGWQARGSEWIRERYHRFLQAALQARLPVWLDLDAFEGTRYASLIVNRLDHHPSREANAIAADSVAEYLLEFLEERAECLDQANEARSAKVESALHEPTGSDQSDEDGRYR